MWRKRNIFLPSSRGPANILWRGRSNLRDCFAPTGLAMTCFLLLSFTQIVYAVEEQTTDQDEQYPRRRIAMVQEQLAEKGIENQAVLDAMKKVPREVFLRPGLRFRAYLDGEIPTEDRLFFPRPIEWARAFELLDVPPNSRVLIVDPGIGYAGAVVSQMARDVFVVVVNSHLLDQVQLRYKQLSYINLYLKAAGFFEGWQTRAPFDRIFIAGVTDAPVSNSLFNQLAPNGILIVPEGKEFQQWVRYTKGEQIERVTFDRCHFPPLRVEQ